MTPRSKPSKSNSAAMPSSRRWLLQTAAGALSLAAITGCDPRQAMFFLQPFEPRLPADCPSLKGKRVVILTAAAGSVLNETGIERELANGLAKALRENVKKIDIVDNAKVAAWSQAKKTWTDPSEAAEAFEADTVIFLEIRNFEVDSPTSPELLQGRSTISIRVIDWDYPKDDKGKPINTRPKESTVIYDGDRETVFPTTGSIPLEAGVTRATFKNKFTKLVISELSWHFIGRATGDDVQDTRIRE
jgi:hypothetical protein